MGSLRCKVCLSIDILFTPGGLTCEDCGGHDVEPASQWEVGFALDPDGQVIELERMFGLVDTRESEYRL